ncbi:MAG: flavodoxin family protein [Actinomycetota bacterium]|nr:flavodoxin family protein [Actinomycetota bacterium]
MAVCGSPVRNGNVAAFLDAALSEYDSKPDVEISRFDLVELKVNQCRHCNWCVRNQVDGKFCAQNDDMGAIYPHLLDCSGIIVASPVHFGRLSSATSCFIDRLRVFVHGNITRGAMRNKVGGAMAVSWFRNAGIEMTLMNVVSAFFSLGMIVASPDIGVWGAGALSSVDGTGRKGETKTLVLEDRFGIASARALAVRVYELASILEVSAKSGE